MSDIPLPPPTLKPWAIGVLHDRVCVAADKDSPPMAAFTPDVAMMLAALLVKHAMAIASAKVKTVVDTAIADVYPPKERN